MIAVIIIVVVVLLLVAGAIGFIGLDRHDEEYWRNSELFLAHTEPLAPGSRVVARYRCQPRSKGGAVGATVDAELRQIELSQSGDQRTGQTWSLAVVDYSTPDLVEIDINVEIPADGVPVTGQTVAWKVAVMVDNGDGTRSEVHRPLVVVEPDS